MRRRDLITYLGSHSPGRSAFARNRPTECGGSVCCCHMLRTTPRPSLIYPRSLRRLKRLGWSQDRNINSFGQGLLERGECVFKCLAEGPAPPIGKRHEALNHLGRRLDV